MKGKSGFTIVELLIVIVVMGILSAIVAVTVSGVQKRAKEAQLVSGIEALEKGLRQYEFKNGHFPNPTDVTESGGFTAACVQPTASGWPAGEGLTSSQCYVLLTGGGGEIGYSTVLRDELLTVASGIPDTKDIIYTVPGVLSARGLMYQYWADDRVALVYFVPNDQKCVRGENKISVGGLLQCVVELKGL